MAILTPEMENINVCIISNADAIIKCLNKKAFQDKIIVKIFCLLLLILAKLSSMLVLSLVHLDCHRFTTKLLFLKNYTDIVTDVVTFPCFSS